jgi:hypothetical protein
VATVHCLKDEGPAVFAQIKRTTRGRKNPCASTKAFGRLIALLELNMIQDVANNVDPREGHAAVRCCRVVLNYQYAGVRPIDIHLEVLWLDVWKSNNSNSLSVLKPTRRTSSAKELRFGAYYILMNSETVLIWTNENRDDKFMVVTGYSD